MFVTQNKSKIAGKARDNDKLSEFESREYRASAKFCHVVMIRTRRFLDEPMHSELLQDSGNFSGIPVWHELPDAFAGKSRDVVFSSGKDLKQLQIVWSKKIEATESPAVNPDSFSKFPDIIDARGIVSEFRDEVEIAPVHGGKNFNEGADAVDAFFHRGEFFLARPVAMFHRTVVIEKTRVIACCFNPEDFSMLVIEFYGSLVHMMFDAGAFDAGMKGTVDLALVTLVEGASEEFAHVGSFHRADRGPGKIFIEDFQFIGIAEGNIEGVFALHDAPVPGGMEKFFHRAKTSRHSVAETMQAINREHVRKFLCASPVVNVWQTVFKLGECDVVIAKFRGQVIVPVAVELQTERRPCRHPQVTKPEFLVHEIKVIVQAFAGSLPQIRCAGLFVMPWTEGGAGFHCGEDVNKSSRIAALTYDFLDFSFFAEGIYVADEFDFKPGIGRDILGVRADFFSEFIHHIGIIEYPHCLVLQESCHPAIPAYRGQRPGNYDPVKTGERTVYFRFVSFYQGVFHTSSSFNFSNFKEAA